MESGYYLFRVNKISFSTFPNQVKANWDMVQAFIESIEYRERFFAAPFCSAN